MTLTGREALSSANASSRSGESLKSRMGGCSSRTLRARSASLRSARCALLELQRGARSAKLASDARHANPPAHAGHRRGRQFSACGAAWRIITAAQTRRLIDLGEDAAGGSHLGKRADNLIQRMALALRRKRQQHLGACRAELQRGSCSASRTSRGPIPAVSINIRFLDLSLSSTRASSLPLFAVCMGAPRMRA